MSAYKISTWAFIIIIIIQRILYSFIYYNCFQVLMHARETRKWTNSCRYETINGVRRRASLRKWVRIDRVRHYIRYLHLCNMTYIIISCILLCMVHRILTLAALKYIHNIMHNYYYYSYRGGSVIGIVLNSISSIYGQQITTITIQLQLFTYCT